MVSTPSIKPLRILAADDDAVVLGQLRHVLETQGHTVVTASGGSTCIGLFTAAHMLPPCFDVVITDLSMPRVGGAAVAEAVKKISPATPVILLTGSLFGGPAEADIPLHVDHMLMKPPRPLDLRRALERLCPKAAE